MTLESDYGEHQRDNAANLLFHDRVYSACAIRAATYIEDELDITTQTADPAKKDNRQLRFARAILAGDRNTTKPIASVLIGANLHPGATDVAIQNALLGYLIHHSAFFFLEAALRFFSR